MRREGPLIAVVASAACFGTLPVLTKFAYEQHMDPLPLLAWRFLIASVLLAIVATLRDRRAVLAGFSDFWRYAVLAVTGYGAASVCYFYALKFASPPVVAVLLYAYPALVTIAGWLFLKHHARWYQGLAVAVTFMGCALVVGTGGSLAVKWQGIALGLGAAVGYTIFNLFSYRWIEGRDRLVMMSFTFGIATILPAAGSIALGGVASLSPAAWTIEGWALLGLIVLIPTFAAVLLYLGGIAKLGPSQAAIVSTFEPLFTIALVAMMRPDEQLAHVQFIGAALVLAGVVWAELGARRDGHPAASETTLIPFE